MTRRQKFLYVIAIIFGFGVDIAIALALRLLFDAPLLVAATGGFFAGLGANYLAFEFTVFARKGAGPSMGRFSLTAAAAGISLGVRLGALALLGQIVPPAYISPMVADAGRFVGAAMVSFGLNYLLIARIFRATPRSGDDL